MRRLKNSPNDAVALPHPDGRAGTPDSQRIAPGGINDDDGIIAAGMDFGGKPTRRFVRIGEDGVDDGMPEEYVRQLPAHQHINLRCGESLTQRLQERQDEDDIAQAVVAHDQYPAQLFGWNLRHDGLIYHSW